MKNLRHRNAVAALPVMGVGLILSLTALSGPSGAWAALASVAALGLATALMVAKPGFNPDQVLVPVRSTQGRGAPRLRRDRDGNS